MALPGPREVPLFWQIATVGVFALPPVADGGSVKVLVTPKLKEDEKKKDGKDKKETFERLIREGKLGYLALLRNLRNMTDAKVDSGLIRDAIVARKGADRVLPFRYIAAARACPAARPT